jgi:hypothetical protein
MRTDFVEALLAPRAAGTVLQVMNGEIMKYCGRELNLITCIKCFILYSGATGVG